jgi:hypothetical protein
VLDFDGPHGDSTAFLVDQVAGPDVAAKLVPLQRPSLTSLGDDVGDFHVLAAVCAVAEEILHGNVPMPDAVNMSFGRRAHSEDPVSAAECALPGVPHTVACDIARAVAQLTQQGTLFVSAAGNHGAPLFPGSLDEVISAGMLDLTRFFDDGSTQPAWETPSDADALIPGNALCLGSWAAPAGSSYSSAMLAGWIARLVKNQNPLTDPADDRTWVPVWNSAPSKLCWSLGKAQLDQTPAPPPSASPYCNATITSIFNELSGSSASCWNAETEPTATAPAVLLQDDPTEGTDPLDTHLYLGTHPTPESDPCVPCSGVLLVAGSITDLRIDLSRSEPLPPEFTLDEVDLRFGDDSYKLGLEGTDLDKMATGQLAALLVPDVAAMLGAHENEPGSVWYRMRPVDGSCDVQEDCFWSSTPLLIDK